jgi:serine protease Do
MRGRKRTTIVLLVLFLLVTLGIGLVTMLPRAVSQLTYAAETGRAMAARGDLQHAADLSRAFHDVATALRPSVVTITSTKKVHLSSNGEGPNMPDVPEEFRKFFGDDFFFHHSQPFQMPREGFQRQGQGSGVVVSRDGYILTNNHVVSGMDEVKVTLSDGRTFPAKTVGTDPKTDVAVLKIDATGLVAAELGDSGAMQVGDWVVAIGSPFGLDMTVTAGIVSAMGRSNMGITDYEDFIQTDAAINPGNSGGPLVNLQGQVIGINTAISSRTGSYNGVGFAIPSNMAQTVMHSLIEKGHVERGWLGAAIQDLNENLSQSFDYEGTEGVLLGDVLDGGPAQKAGLQAGDIVVKYQGKRMKDANQFRHAVAATEPGTDATLVIFRNGKQQTITIHIAQMDADSVVARPGGEESSDLGISVQTLTPDARQQLGYEGDEQGVVVTEVEPGSLAASLGIRPKDLIVVVGGQTIRSASDFRKALDKNDLSKGIRLQVMRDGVQRFVFAKVSG